MVPGEADGWVELCVQRAADPARPIRFERELIATGRYLPERPLRGSSAASRKRAACCSRTSRHASAFGAGAPATPTRPSKPGWSPPLPNATCLPDIVEGTDAFVQVVDPNFRLCDQRRLGP